MTFPTTATRTATGDASGSNLHSIALGGPSAGDLLIAICVSANAGGAYVIHEGVSGPRWAPMGQFVGSSLRVGVYGKIAEGGDALSLFTVSTVRMASLCYRFTGHGSAAAIGTSATATSTNGNAPAVNMTGAAQDSIFLAALATVSSVASAAPASYGTLTTASAGTAFLSIAERNLNANTDDPAAFTNTSQEWVALALAIPSLAIATNARISRESAELLSGVDANARLSRISAEALSGVNANMVLSRVSVEMLSENVPDGLSDPNKYRQILIAT